MTAGKTQLVPAPVRTSTAISVSMGPFCRRDADAAHSRSGESLRRGESRSKIQDEMDGYLTHYVGRPSPLYFAERLTDYCSRSRPPGLMGAKIYPQARGAQSHPARTRSTTCSARSCWRGAWARNASSPRPAPACTASPPPRCARASGSNASSIWAPVDVERQKANVFRMNMLGAKVVPVESARRRSRTR